MDHKTEQNSAGQRNKNRNGAERVIACLRRSRFIQKIELIVKKNRYSHLLLRGLKSICCNGFAETGRKVIRKVRNKIKKTATGSYWAMLPELRRQRKKQFSKKIKFSVIVPLYNTPEKFLKEMIRSVIRQSYTDWELCLADGSDAQHTGVGEICRRMALFDKRIRYQKLEKNQGISGNTNACLNMAQGDYIARLDHDDMLHPSALFEVMQAVCEKDADFIYTDECVFRKNPNDAEGWHYKPDYAPDMLRSCNYICHFTVFSRKLQKTIGEFRPECDGSQDHDMVLRLTEKAHTIVHIPRILYYWRAHSGSVAENVGVKPYAVEAGIRAIEDHLKRIGLKGAAFQIEDFVLYRVKYEIEREPLISILIPSCDHRKELETCIDSILNKSSYKNFEIIVIENNSTEDETFAYYDEIQKKHSNVRVVRWDGIFNYASINNFGAQYAKGEYLLLLNNDIEVISESWLEEMLMYAQRGDVGAVGAKLYFPDNTIQHAGVILGMLGTAGHAFHCAARGNMGHMGRLAYAQNYSAVTGACLMLRRSVWEQVGGLDETFAVALNDVDLCMRIRKAGYLIVWTPFAELYHAESKSRGYDNSPEKQRRFDGEAERFKNRWKTELEEGDPYYNPNLSLDSVNFERKPS